MQKLHAWALWPGLLAIGPLVIAGMYVAHAMGYPVAEEDFNKYVNEMFAVVLLAVVLAILLIRSIRQRSLLYLLLAGFALTAWLREIHFEWTHRGVYVLLLALIACAWWWRERLKPLAQAGNFMPWFKAMLVVYLLSVLVSRRVFRGLLPHEPLLHVALEETLENVAHSMLLVIALAGHWRKPGGGAREG